ncbi:MAG: protease inhibitor I42 family protein [Rubrivivax sp.]|nr:protease inhibitor I42 family protein [Rubrivivax sp.]
MTLGEADAGSRIGAKVGDVIELRLAENPTTGFRWTLLPTAAVAIAGDRMDNAIPAPGAGGMRVLSLQVLQPGEHQVRLRCERSWEGEATAVGRFELTLVVN